MTGEEQRAITAISNLAGPTEDATFREYCTKQGIWTPGDLLYLSGLEDNTLMLDQQEGYEPSVVVFYCLFLYGYGHYPFEPCIDTPRQGEPDPGPYPGINATTVGAGVRTVRGRAAPSPAAAAGTRRRPGVRPPRHLFATAATTQGSFDSRRISGRRRWVGHQAEQEGNEETGTAKGTAERGAAPGGKR